MERSVRGLWTATLGFALGGFFDGILLHQILQWHHLLSLVPEVADLRLQVLWDGYFHASMYGLAAIALWQLWRRPGQSGRLLAAGLLAGFGLWHMVDAVLSHWLLGIHRIRVDSPVPLAWDLGWVVLFGLVPFGLGQALARGGGPPSARRAMPLLLATLASIGTGAWSLRPPPGQPLTVVVFAPGVSPGSAMNAIGALDARLVWADPAMGVVVVDLPHARRSEFFRRGALMVSGTTGGLGCFAWSQPS
ncbi:DUF2243 domain-containing protein [Aquabacter spiritensis]|uniref:Putative membrane protein n=1 Tax=Aquabacter spiritensis TaxID=933073 RepID=A0A4R3LU19_9HYPH|nr:DUF2243 domain-containing protein [Aquabacter spiritensis]TCT02145.1 putative membrane protein [Aquabacter spiritensis]